MKMWMKATICISLSLMCIFSSIGFAALSDTLGVTGTADIDIPYGLFITSVTTDTNNVTNIDKNIVEHIPYTTTVDSILSRSRSTGKVVYKITVLNNTKLTYSYRGIYFQEDLAGYNGNIHVSTSTGRSNIGVVCSLANASAQAKKVAPGETLEFTVTYTVGSSRNADTDWRTLINFQFGINVDGEREALEVVEEKFLNILNTMTTYERLVDALDNKFDGVQEWTSNYIGNVTGSSSEDSMAVNTLFAGQLQITVGDEQMDATVLIKHENLDGNRLTGDDYTATHTNGGVFHGYGCEMTLYLTIDPLNRAGAYVPVYAVVFTCDRDENGNMLSDWYRIGSTYAGTANVVTYDGGTGTGSFVTDNWIADAATYKLIDGYDYTIKGERYQLNAYSHRVANGVSIKTIVSAKDTNAVTTLQTLLNDARRIMDNVEYAGIGIDLIKETYESLAPYYTVDASGSHAVDPDLTLAQISPAIANLYRDVNAALIRIDALIKEQAAT
ncbi:MAG: hypothetical protein IKA76_08100 [Clostridia bacterium]|nr:hypothetical protein [Clostridia bacterium]